MSDDRPKKSWRELDRQKDRSDHRRDDRGGGGRAPRVERSAAYSAYKGQLDKLFTAGSGAELPESLKAKLGPPDASDQKNQALTQALRADGDAGALAAYLKAELALPEDARLLLRLLDVSDQQLLPPVLEKLLEIVESGKKPNRMLALQKIDALIMRLGDGPAVDLANDLRAALDG